MRLIRIVLERCTEALERLDDVVAVGLLFDREAERSELPREELGLGERPGVRLAVPLDLLLVTVGLPVLAPLRRRLWPRLLAGVARAHQAAK